MTTGDLDQVLHILERCLEGLDRERGTIRGCVRDLQRAGDVPALSSSQLLLSFAAMEISRAMETITEAQRKLQRIVPVEEVRA